MRRADSPCRFPTVVAVLLATALCVFVCTLLFAPPASRAAAAVEPLTVSVDPALSLVGRPVTVMVSGQVPDSIEGAELVVLIRGPVAPAEVGRSDVEAPEVARVVNLLTEQPTGKPAGQTPAKPTGETIAGQLASPEAVVLGADADLAKGVLDAEVALPSGTPEEPGAYLLEVQVNGDGEVWASGQVWVGKAAERDTLLDVAFVLPISLGIHRDPTGAYYDQALEDAVVSTDSASGGLAGLLDLFDRFPTWDLTLAPEPILLSQLRDMADGYPSVDSSGNRMAIGENDPTAIAAAAVLSDLKQLAGQARVEIAVSPYAGADLGIIAAQGWRDGLEQIQMGKQELQQTLGLDAPLIGACSPALELTSDSLAYYAQASIDHVVVDETLRDQLAERVSGGAVAVRACNAESDRVTLVLASGTMSAIVAQPWNGALFAAALAAELATTPRDAIVITPGTAFTVPPVSYLESIGKTLAGADWIRTQTLTALIRAHSPGTRPVLLQTGSAKPEGYIEEALLTGLMTAHAAVTDLAAVSDATRAPVDSAYRLLATAESRWWSRPQISPKEASIGLDYAAQAQAIAQGELDKVRFLNVGSTFFTGGNGVLELTMENTAAYPITAELRLTGTGVEFPDGEKVKVELQTGTTPLQVRVVRAEGGPRSFDAQLVAGTGVLDEFTHSVRFLGLTTILPWLIVAVVVIAAAAFLIARRIARKRQGAKPTL